MGVYSYKAVDSKGKQVKGTLDATSEMDVSKELSKLGYLPVNISFKGEASSGKTSNKKIKKV